MLKTTPQILRRDQNSSNHTSNFTHPNKPLLSSTRLSPKLSRIWSELNSWECDCGTLPYCSQICYRRQEPFPTWKSKFVRSFRLHETQIHRNLVVKKILTFFFSFLFSDLKIGVRRIGKLSRGECESLFETPIKSFKSWNEFFDENKTEKILDFFGVRTWEREPPEKKAESPKTGGECRLWWSPPKVRIDIFTLFPGLLNST